MDRWNSHACQVNNSLYELYKPVGNHEMQIVFFHGLPLEDFSATHLSTWESEDGSCLWPKTWLAKEFPNAHILVASYNESLRESVEHLDMYVISENLMFDLLDASIGQRRNCPVVLVGHSFGGLVIKNLCVLTNHLSSSHGNVAHATQAKKFLDNVKGIFYYSTPHHGSYDIGKATNILDSPLFKYFTPLNSQRERLNHDFDHLHKKWQTRGLGEGQPVNSGLFHDVIIVPGASAREGENFSVDESANHFSITKPRKKTSRRFTALKELLQYVMDENHPQNWQRLPKQVKGLDFRLDQVKAKLKNHKLLGFAGMGGLGKTTLAKAAFNKFASTFEYTCFVCNVKLIKGTEKELKKELWKDMHCDGKKVGIKEEWFTVRGKKLLLVLDDIAMDRDIEVLLDIASDTSSESRFIVTSRDYHFLKGLDDVYDVPLLDDNNSKELFMSYAFPNQERPPPRLASHMDTIVEKCNGLPLTLAVLGQYLRTIENEKHWKHTLEALDKAEGVIDLDQRLWAKLRLSYDGLGEKEQQMFLDATTFFANTNWALSDALVAWSQVYETTNVWPLWQSLVSRSLVYKVEKDERIQIHDQLKSLGRKIASESSDNGQCRVWEQTEACKVLQTSNRMDNKEYHAFQLVKKDGHNEVINIGGSALHQLKNVRFLELDGVVIDRIVEVESCLRKLVLLKCVGLKFFNPTVQSSLVILNIDLGEELLPSSIGQLVTLRVLALSNAKVQNTMPEEIGNLLKLERLILKEWVHLQNLPKSFGTLSALERLTFCRCEKLEALPKSFGNLLALEHLEFWECNKLEALPESFGNLSALKHLEFYTCDKLEALPESFGNLSALKHLEFYRCDKLETLPESFGNLSALEHLGFDNCDKLEALPESFGNLSALEHLEFYRCDELEALPKSFGNLLTLKHLEFDKCDKLEALPESFGDLSTLEHLVFYRCDKLEALPESFKNLLALKHLVFDKCDKLEALPESFGNLLALEHLVFYRCDKLEGLPESFGNLLALEHLVFYRCDKLEALPEFLGNLSALEHLEFIRCSFLIALPESFDHLAKLQYLNISEAFDLCGTGKLLDCLAELMALRHLVVDCVLVGEMGTTSLPLSQKTFRVQDGQFSLTQEQRMSTDEELEGFIRLLHQKAMKKMSAFDFEGAVADLCRAELVVLNSEVGENTKFHRFLSQERGIAKRLCGDLKGSLEDLTATVDAFSEENGIDSKYAYDCWKHRGYVKYLLGDLDGAQIDGEMALWLLSKYECASMISPCMGEESVTYMHFRLTNTSRIEEERQLMASSHSCVMEKVRATDFEGALAIGEDFDARLSGFHDKGLFFQERGDDKDDIKAAEDSEKAMVQSRQEAVMQVFIKEVINGAEDGYFVSKIWLFSLDEHEKKELFSALCRAGYLEIYQTHTTIFYERMEDSVQVPTTNDDPSCTIGNNEVCVGDTKRVVALHDGDASGRIEQTRFNTEIQDGDVLDSEMSTLSLKRKRQPAPVQTSEISPVDVPRSLLEKGEAPLTGCNKMLMSLKTAVKDTSLDSYPISTHWLSTLDDHQVEDLNSVLFKAGYSQIYKTSTTTYFERIRSHVQYSPTGQRETESKSGQSVVVGDVKSSSILQKNGDSIADDLQGIHNGDRASFRVTSAIGSGSKTDAHCECPPLPLTVSCTPPPQSPMAPSTSSSQGEPVSKLTTRQPVGDFYVTMPKKTRKGLKVLLTGVDKDIPIRTWSFTGAVDYIEATVPVNVSAGTTLRCCIRGDQNDMKVRIDFLKIGGEVKIRESIDRTTIALVLKSVRTNVSAFINNYEEAEGPEPISLCLEEEYSRPPCRRVLDTFRPFDDNGQSASPEAVVWLAPSEITPRNCESGSTTLELRCHDRKRLTADLQECSSRAHGLLFDKTEAVVLEGNFDEDLDPNSFLEFDVRYQLEVSYPELRDPLPQDEPLPFLRTTRITEVVEFDCRLEFRTKDFSYLGPVH